jgi:hypothetical protein
MMDKVELKSDGNAYLIVIDGEAKLRRNADGTWGSAEPGWKIHPAPIQDSRSLKSWAGWEFIKPDGTRLDHVFGLNEDGTGFICAITATRRMS